MSSRITLTKSAPSGVGLRGSVANSSQRCFSTGVSSSAGISAVIFSAIGSGRPFGADRPSHWLEVSLP